MTKIFISYRREDSQWPADRLAAALKPHVADPENDIFLDIDNVPLGIDFPTHIDSMVARCDVLLALIGSDWLDIRHPVTGQRRLDDAGDFVRIEIASALKRGIPVVPVLLDGAFIPKAADLPEDLKALATRNAIEVRRATFDFDSQKLIKGIGIRKGEAKPPDSQIVLPPKRLPRFNPDRYVFISYPKDIAPALMRSIVRRLFEEGIPVWLFDPQPFAFADKELDSMRWLLAGQEWQGPAIDALTQSKCVLLLVGRATSKGQFQPVEVKLAVERRPVVTAIVDDLPFSELPLVIRELYAPRLEPRSVDSEETKRAINQLVVAVKKHVASPRISVSPRWTKTASYIGSAIALAAGAAWLLFADPFGWRDGSQPVADGTPGGNSSVGATAPSANSPIGTEAAERAFAAAAAEGPAADRVFRDCADCPEMVALPAGSFTMGSRGSEKGRYLEEGPQHPVDIAYQLAAGRSEVTVRQYLACVTDGACKQPEWRDPETSAYNKDSYAALGPALEAPDNPVVGVSWNDAQDYAGWLSKRTGLSYRLLTESEWEYAARAGSQTAYSFGDVITHDLANYDGGPETTTIAGKYSANAFGLYDMHGNAAEWVADCHVGAYSGQSSDGGAIALCGTSAARMFRGGSWLSEPLKLRSASRNWLEPTMRTSILGFRIARRK